MAFRRHYILSIAISAVSDACRVLLIIMRQHESRYWSFLFYYDLIIFISLT